MHTSLLQPIDLPLSQAWFHPAASASAATAGSSRPPLHQHHYQQQYLPFQSPYQSPYPFAYQSAYPYTSYALHQSPSKAAPLQPATRLQQPFIFGLPPHPVPDRHAVPELEPASSPSEPGSPMSTLAPPTPNPESVHVVCNAPLLAPKPLPYRPPAFLNTFDLPDPDADLSRPPYTNSAAARSKRKRSGDSDDVSAGEDSAESTPVGKRRATEAAWRGRVPTGTLNGVASQRRYSS